MFCKETCFYQYSQRIVVAKRLNLVKKKKKRVMHYALAYQYRAGRNGLFCPRSYFMNTKYIVTIKIEKKAVR